MIVKKQQTSSKAWLQLSGEIQCMIFPSGLMTKREKALRAMNVPEGCAFQKRVSRTYGAAIVFDALISPAIVSNAVFALSPIA